MNSVNYEVKCLLCGDDVGQFVDGSFVSCPGHAATPRAGGVWRCSRCGGSLYFEPFDVSPFTVDRAEHLRTITADAAKRRRAS